jgi:hypothetical protein
VLNAPTLQGGRRFITSRRRTRRRGGAIRHLRAGGLDTGGFILLYPRQGRVANRGLGRTDLVLLEIDRARLAATSSTRTSKATVCSRAYDAC